MSNYIEEEISQMALGTPDGYKIEVGKKRPKKGKGSKKSSGGKKK